MATSQPVNVTGESRLDTWRGPSLAWGEQAARGAGDALGMLIPTQDSRLSRLPSKSRGAVPSQLQLSPTWGYLQPPAPLLMSTHKSQNPNAGSISCPSLHGPVWGGRAGEVRGGLERAPAAQGARVGGRAAGEPILAKDGPCFPELSPLITESG